MCPSEAGRDVRIVQTEVFRAHNVGCAGSLGFAKAEVNVGRAKLPAVHIGEGDHRALLVVVIHECAPTPLDELEVLYAPKLPKNIQDVRSCCVHEATDPQMT